jgi:hypothetical protein
VGNQDCSGHYCRQQRFHHRHRFYSLHSAPGLLGSYCLRPLPSSEYLLGEHGTSYSHRLSDLRATQYVLPEIISFSTTPLAQSSNLRSHVCKMPLLTAHPPAVPVVYKLNVPKYQKIGLIATFAVGFL